MLLLTFFFNGKMQIPDISHKCDVDTGKNIDWMIKSDYFFPLLFTKGGTNHQK